MSEPPLEISCRELQELLAGGSAPVLIDCREPEEHEHAAIARSILVPLSSWEESLPGLKAPSETPLVVYCHFGVRSRQAAALLRQAGYECVQSLAGGIDAWATEIDPSVPRY